MAEEEYKLQFELETLIGIELDNFVRDTTGLKRLWDETGSMPSETDDAFRKRVSKFLSRS